MPGTRVSELAKELGMTNAEMIQTLTDLGVAVSGPAALLDAETAEIVREMLQSEAGAGQRTVEVSPTATVKELAEALGVSAADLQKRLMDAGVLVSINQRLSPDQAKSLASQYGLALKFKVEERPAAKPRAKGPAAGPRPRPPVVTVMGHVDHGKTTLLDYIRKTRVVDGEFGGITQHIGAYQVEVPVGGEKRKITFIDTPGHAAFTAMRARGASVTDIVVLVVAADDGIMPQTEEAIDHARAADVPIVVAINKIDKPEANPDRVMAELTKVGLVPTQYGGQTECVAISALTGQGVDDLLEHVLFVADTLGLKADPNAPLRGVILEARQEVGRGAVATVLVLEGTLRTGDCIVCGTVFGKIRAMTTERGERVNKAGPSMPVEIMGLSGVPNAGDHVQVVADERTARIIAREREEQVQARSRVRRPVKFTLDERKELPLVVKADVQGSLEAVVGALTELKQEEVTIKILRKAVGNVTESDVQMAAAAQGMVIGFNVRVDGPAQAAAEREHVEIRTYQIIYELTEAMERLLKGMLEPEYEEVPLGKAEVRATFRTPRGVVIAGCYVTEGKVVRNADVRVVRARKAIFTGKVDSLRHLKDDVREMAQGFECGIVIDGFNDFQVGDVLEVYETRQVQPV